MELIIEPARPADAADILALLAQHHLPAAGLEDHLETTLVARRESRVVGSAALEVYADGALLRSVAVAPEVQGQGLGRDLAAAAERMARGLQIPALYLLTTTAEAYFPKLGFERVAREDVPESVQASVEFTTACPSSAIVMRKQLK